MAFKPFQNYRATPTVTASPEDFTITSGVALLAEAPADPATYAMTVTVGGNPRTRVTGTPASGQYRVKVSAVIDSGNATHVEYLPILEFHSSDEGLAGTATYYRTGSIFTAEWASSLVTFLKPQYGLASAGDLPAVTTDVLARGGPGDMAFLTNGAMYVSDGTQWLAAAGGAGAKFAVTKTITAAALVQTSYTATVASDAFVNLTASQVNVDISAAALVQEQGKTSTVSADGYVDAMHLTATITADAAVKTTSQATATADAALKFAATATVSADASVSEGSGGTTLTFESDTEGMTLSSFARSATSPITGSYSLRYQGTISAATYPYAQKSVTITNGATVSFKCKASVGNSGDADGSARFALIVDGVSRASSQYNVGDSGVRTVSWTNTLATGSRTLKVECELLPNNADGSSVATSFEVWTDDITFS